jgi:hypothetical protein
MLIRYPLCATTMSSHDTETRKWLRASPDKVPPGHDLLTFFQSQDPDPHSPLQGSDFQTQQVLLTQFSFPRVRQYRQPFRFTPWTRCERAVVRRNTEFRLVFLRGKAGAAINWACLKVEVFATLATISDVPLPLGVVRMAGIGKKC